MLARTLAATLAALAAAGSAAAQTPTRTAPIEVTGTPESDSLVTPRTEDARKIIERTPGAVEVVPDTAWRNGPAMTIKDTLDYVPGVFVQPKWGDDSRLSIRGSGLSRNFHLRSTQLYMDGIPINTADGYGDFQEIDPSAYRYIEVYRGANALRYGANSLGGAVNFVTPTGRDASLIAAGADIGSFDFHRAYLSSGMAAGPFDYFITVAGQEADGFRDHSDGESIRGSGNLGYRLAPNVETRFYLNANSVRQRIPGDVTRAIALSTPRTGAAINATNDWQRNIDTVRLANKTTLLFGPMTVDIGAFYVNRHLMHPIFQWLDYRYDDYGGFGRLSDERQIAGHDNKFTLGLNIVNGRLDNRQFANGPGAVKGALLSASRDNSENYSLYAENAFSIVPGIALVLGGQYLYASRERNDRFLADGDQSGKTTHSLFSPKAGLLWDIDPGWQAFANVSRGAEVPSFGESMAGVPFTQIRPQRTTTFEIGSRGTREDYTWDVAVYRAQIKNELQCLFSTFGNCNVTNADRTVHQGLELGGGASLLKGLAVGGDKPDRVWFQAAYAFNDFRFDGDRTFGDNELPGAPRHFLRAELLYKHPAGFHAGPNVEWVPEAYYVDSANTQKTQAYLLWGLRVGYDDGGAFSAYLEGRNLGDREYISTVSIINVATAASPLYSPGSGRAVYAGARFKW